MRGFLYRLDCLWLYLSRFMRKSYKANICGHKTKLRGVMKFEGDSTIMRMLPQENGSPDYCLDCIAKMTIKCAWCGSPIWIGRSITLYAPTKKFKIPEYAVRYTDHGHLELVGCLRSMCAMTGADMCGLWLPPGRVERFLSPMELALATNKAVFVNDISNYPESVSLEEIT